MVKEASEALKAEMYTPVTLRVILLLGSDG